MSNITFDRKTAIKYLEKYLAPNKARGMAGQAALFSWLREERQKRHAQKCFTGCWLLSPKDDSERKKRVCFFVNSRCVESADDVKMECEGLLEDRLFHAVCGKLAQCGLGVVFTVPVANPAQRENMDEIDWHFFRYLNEKLVPFDGRTFFEGWAGGKGRAVINKTGWDNDVNTRFENLDDTDLTAMVTAQAFYYGFLKVRLRKSFTDAYDVDCFIASHQGTVLPVEIKEKSPGGDKGSGFFGIDAGRILMLLRLCLPVDANAAYVVREIKEGGGREFVGWKVLTLDRLVMSASWNLQAGGKGMGGGNTQTVLMPYSLFEDLDDKWFEDSHLNAIGQISINVKKKATEFQTEIESLFSPK